MDPRPLREAEVVNYADKRVLHEDVVTLAARFADLKVRYGRTPEALARIQATEVRSRALEDKLFAPLRLTPLDLLRVNGEKRQWCAVRTLTTNFSRQPWNESWSFAES